MNRKPIALLLLLVLAAGAAAEGPPTPQQALDRGIAWLRAQAKDGVWMVEFEGKQVPEPGFTALALAPVAAALPEGERAKDPIVKAASAFLLAAQREDGAIRAGQSTYENYYTSSALLALTIVGDPATLPAREKMKEFLLTLQRQEEGRAKGGFGYNTQGGADLSNAQFAVESLRSAGIPEDHPAMKRALLFLERVQNRSENEANEGVAWEVDGRKVVPGNDGSAGYEPGVSKADLRQLPDGTFEPRGYGSMTYALLKCYLLAGVKPDDARVQAAVGWLSRNYSWERNPGFEDMAKARPEAPYWGLYYYYMTAAKALRLAGVQKLATPDGERDWRVDLGRELALRQQEDGSWRNEKSPRWEEGDPILTTAYATIALQEILRAP